MKKFAFISILLIAGCTFLNEKPASELPAEAIVTDDNTLYLSTLGPLYALFWRN